MKYYFHFSVVFSQEMGEEGLQDPFPVEAANKMVEETIRRGDRDHKAQLESV